MKKYYLCKVMRCSLDLMQNMANISSSLVSKSLPIIKQISSNSLYFNQKEEIDCLAV